MGRRILSWFCREKVMTLFPGPQITSRTTFQQAVELRGGLPSRSVKGEHCRTVWGNGQDQYMEKKTHRMEGIRKRASSLTFKNSIVCRALTPRG